MIWIEILREKANDILTETKPSLPFPGAISTPLLPHAEIVTASFTFYFISGQEGCLLCLVAHSQSGYLLSKEHPVRVS